MTTAKKPQYYNFSPDISYGDDSQEMTPVREPEQIPAEDVPVSRRRRNGRRRGDVEPVQSAERVASKRTVSTGKKEDRGVVEKKKDVSSLKEWLNSTVTKSVVGLILGGLGFWFAVAFVSYFFTCVADQSAVLSNAAGSAVRLTNDAGEGGARVTELLINQGFGVGAAVIVVWLICMSLKLLTGYPRFRSLDFTIKCLIAFITLSVVVGMLSIGLDTDVNWGGFHGRFINEKIYEYIGWSGAIILSVVLISIFVVICLRDVIKWIMKKKRAYDEKRRAIREAKEEEARKEAEILAMKLQEEKDQAMSGDGDATAEAKNFDPGEYAFESVEFDPASDTIYDIPDLDDDEDASITNLDEIQREPDPLDIVEDDNSENADNVDNVDNDDNPDNSDNSDNSENDDNADNPEIMTVNVNQIEKGSGTTGQTYDTDLFTHEYRFPSTNFLKPGVEKISVDADEQLANKERIKQTLLDFGIPITSIEATVGPTVTLYEIRPDTGVKIARIRNLEDDIALSLAAEGVRIIAPIPGKGTVGIEVENRVKQTVSMRTIIESKVYRESKYKLPVALGSTISNEVYIADLAKMPHLLVAGATGQGKSVGLNAIITSLLYSKRPEELKFVMVDPKRVEFSLYAKIEKYYLAQIPDSPQPIITNMENVVATLSSLCVEMDERYKLLEKAYVRQVSEYNDKFKSKKLDPREGHRYMPYIVVVIDEFADLIMTAGKEVEIPIARLAQLARAVGIHVIIATQRPSTNVITGMIKANFPVRIAFKVSSGVDSKTILDSTGAQQLIGRGDMLISNNGVMTRVQCAFIDTPEVEEVCDYISHQPYPQGPYILPEPQVGGDMDAMEKDPASIGKKDPLLEEVARQVVMSGVASTSQVQRRYEIGFNRAGRIMDQLQALGIVGPATGGKPRNVLVDEMTLEDILSGLG